MKNNWWKALAVVLVIYTLIQGILGEVPRLAILNETIRNLYFHVTMWFSMLILFIVSIVYSIKYLSKEELKYDVLASEAATVGGVFGLIGLATGTIWARYTWGAFWVNDPKLNGSAAAMLVYAAYFLLRSAIEDEQKKARISAVYNIFSFVITLVLIFVLPRLTDSLHPGNGGNPGFSNYDLDSNMRMVFYPAIIGWTLIGVWMMTLRVRIRNVEEKLHQD